MSSESPGSIYRFAAVGSIALHLIFVSAAEAAVFLSQVFGPPTRYPFVTITTVHRKAPASVDQVPSIKVPAKSVILSGAPAKIRGGSATLSGAKNPDLRSGSGAKDDRTYGTDSTKGPRPFDRALKNFKDVQAALDKRIQDFKSNLTDLARQREKIAPTESLESYVSDLEKVPIAVRRDLLPAYLKRMRLRIAKHWFEAIQSLNLAPARATVRYRIAPDGMTSNLNILDSSGEGVFDQACLTAVRSASPFDPLSFDFVAQAEGQFLTIKLTFHFRKVRSEKFV